MTKRLISTIIIMVTLLSLTTILIVQAADTINIGDYVQMGKYYAEPILWRCVDIDKNGPLMIADKILTIKPFDAKGTHKYSDGTTQEETIVNGRGYRVNYGSNLWETSNIRSWLNSTETSSNIAWTDGCPPNAFNIEKGLNAYESEKGFMANGNFTEDERKVIKSVTQKSLLNEVDSEKLKIGGKAKHTFQTSIIGIEGNYDTAYYHNVTDKIFLLDVKQLSRVWQNRAIRGESYYIGKPTQRAVDNSEYKDSSLKVGSFYCCLLRTPSASSDRPHSIRFVIPNGYSGYITGIRPALYIDLTSDIFKSGNGSVASPYVVNGGNELTPTYTPTPTPSSNPAQSNNSFPFLPVAVIIAGLLLGVA